MDWDVDDLVIGAVYASRRFGEVTYHGPDTAYDGAPLLFIGGHGKPYYCTARSINLLLAPKEHPSPSPAKASATGKEVEAAERHISWMQRRDAEYYERAMAGFDPFFPLSTSVQLQREAARASAETRTRLLQHLERTAP